MPTLRPIEALEAISLDRITPAAEVLMSRSAETTIL